MYEVWIAWPPGKLKGTTVLQVIKTFLHLLDLENCATEKGRGKETHV
jgi:hypothetical protein